jgi:hypothetical protein
LSWWLELSTTTKRKLMKNMSDIKIMVNRWVIGILLLVFFQPCFSEPTTTLPSDTNASINDYNNSLDIDPYSKVTFVPPNGQTHDFFEVIATSPGNSGLNVTVSKQGGVEAWVLFDGSSSTDFYVQPGDEVRTNFTVTVPPSTPSTIYYTNITVNSSFGENAVLNLTVNVTDDVGMFNVTVKDPLGDPIGQASVFIWTPLNVLVDTGTTNSNGTYDSKWLQPGNYTVEATAAGYDVNTNNGTLQGDLNVTKVTVILDPVGAPILEVSPVSISETAYTGSQVTKTLIISNTGDLSLVNVTLNATVGWISFSKTLITSIAPFGEDTVTAYLGPLGTAGTYQGAIVVNSENDGNQTITTILDVRESGGDDSPTGGGETPSTGGFPPSVRDLEIVNFVNKINATRGGTKLVGINVENTGDVRLSEVSVSMGGPFNTRVSPESAEILAGFTKIFLVSIDVPADAELGTTNFIVIASGGGVSDTKNLEVEVLPLRDADVEENLRDTINEMRQLIDSIWGEAVRLGTEGYDMETVFATLQNATRRINNAEGSVDLGNYPSARLELGNVRNFAENAVNQMAELKARTVVTTSPLVKYFIIAGVILVAVTVFVFSQSTLLKRELHRRNKIYTALLTTFNLKRPDKPKGDKIPVARLKKDKPAEKKETANEGPKEKPGEDF